VEVCCTKELFKKEINLVFTLKKEKTFNVMRIIRNIIVKRLTFFTQNKFIIP